MHTLLLLLPLCLQVADNGELQLVDATDAWVAHTPLYLAVMFSLVIAALCALLVVALLVLQGLALLRKVNADLQVGRGRVAVSAVASCWEQVQILCSKGGLMQH